MSVQKRTWKTGAKVKTAWRVRWEDAQGWHSKTFDRKADADDFDREVGRLRRVGSLAQLDAGIETLGDYVADTWNPTYGTQIATKTRQVYGVVYAAHLDATFGHVPLRQITPDLIARWQSERLAAGAGPVSVNKAHALLGSILQRAAESERIPRNPARLVRKAKVRKRPEVRPLAPATVEAMRAASTPRDATLISLLAYAGLRPGEALGLRWADVQERTLLVERAISLGETKDTKTGAHRTVRLLDPLRADLDEWRELCGRPAAGAPVIPSSDGALWSEHDWRNWRKRGFRRALAAAVGVPIDEPLSQACAKCKAEAGAPCRTPSGREARATHTERVRGRVDGRPYDLRHSFASLLLHEGRSVIYVARQLGHDARLTLSTYGHVMDELEDARDTDAEAMIWAARSSSAAHTLPNDSGTKPLQAAKSADLQEAL